MMENIAASVLIPGHTWRLRLCVGQQVGMMLILFIFGPVCYTIEKQIFLMLFIFTTVAHCCTSLA